MLFHFLGKLCERTSVAITTNLSFCERATVFRDAKMTTASLKCLTTAVTSLNRKRQLPLQGKLSRCSPEKDGGKPALDPSMTRNP